MVPASSAANGDSGGTSAGLPVKSYDDAIGPGELLAEVALGLDAQPATITRASSQGAAELSGFMASLQSKADASVSWPNPQNR
jgi:hypothetical protein